MRRAQIALAIRQALDRRGISAYRASLDAGLPGNAIRYALEERATKSDRLGEICDALGLEFYVGPPRSEPHDPEAAGLSAAALRDMESGAQALNRVVAGAGGDPIPDDLWPVLAARRGGIPPDESPAGALPVDVVELATAGAADGEQVTERAWFRRDWLDRHGLDPARCVVIGVEGESMEPTLWPGASVLVDRSRKEWRPGDVFAVRLPDGLMVGRAGESEAGERLLVGDHPDWQPLALPDEAEIVGTVVWTGRTLLKD